MIRKDLRTEGKSAFGRGERDDNRARMIYKEGQQVFFVESHSHVRSASVVRRLGNLYTIRIGGGGITLRESRLFPTKEAAEQSVHKTDVIQNTEEPKMSIASRYRSPYDYENMYSPYGI